MRSKCHRLYPKWLRSAPKRRYRFHASKNRRALPPPIPRVVMVMATQSVNAGHFLPRPFSPWPTQDKSSINLTRRISRLPHNSISVADKETVHSEVQGVQFMAPVLQSRPHQWRLCHGHLRPKQPVCQAETAYGGWTARPQQPLCHWGAANFGLSPGGTGSSNDYAGL